MRPYTVYPTTLILLIGVLVLLATPALGASSSQVELDIEINASYNIKENYLNENYILGDNRELINDSHFRRDRSYNLVYVTPSLSFIDEKHFEAYLSADLFWENPVEDEQDNELDAELSSAFISLKGDKIRADLGFQPVQFGDGFIMADDAPAALLHMDLGKGYAEIKGALAMDSSPIFGLTLGFRPGYFEHVEIFGIQYRDQDDAIAASAPLIYQLSSDLSSQATLNYYGASAKLFVGDALLTLTGAHQTGDFTIAGRTREGSADVEAWFGDIGLERNFSDWFSIGIFCFYASGKQVDDPLEDKLNAWVSVMPYNSHATIFFDPDFYDKDDADRLTFGGGFAGGVIAPGINMTFIFPMGLSAEASWINFYADEALNDGVKWYGWEADIQISYTFREQYRLFVEAARFEHGDYFESLLNETVDPAMRFTAGMSASF